MATFIDFVLEDEQALEVSRFLNKIKTKGKEGDDAFEKECAQLVQGKKLGDLLRRLVDESSIIFTEASDKEIEGFFFIIATLIKKLPKENQHDLLMRVISVLTTPEDKSLLRLRILSNLHDIFQDATIKYELFAATLKFARAINRVDLVLPHFKDIESRIREWGITSKQTRELYKLIRDSLQASKKSIEAYKWTIKYLATFEAGFDQSEAAGAREEAINAALDAIRLPDLFQFDTLLDSLPIKQLDTDNNNATSNNKIQTSKLLQLLKIFVSGAYEDFLKFHNENSDFLKSAGLDSEELTRKMRLLSLATLAAANQEVPYHVIAKSLQVPEDEVEVWVIMAIGESILEAKMDQLRKLVIISRSLQRVFTPTQWKQLGDRLNVWKGNIKVILNTLQDCKQQQQNQLHAALTSQT